MFRTLDLVLGEPHSHLVQEQFHLEVEEGVLRQCQHVDEGSEHRPVQHESHVFLVRVEVVQVVGQEVLLEHVHRQDLLQAGRVLDEAHLKDGGRCQLGEGRGGPAEHQVKHDPRVRMQVTELRELVSQIFL